MRARKRTVLVPVLVLASCTSFESAGTSPPTDVRDAGASVGADHEPCYPNATCNAGLVCRDRLCVRPDEPTSGVPDGGGLIDATVPQRSAPNIVCGCGPTGTDDCCRGSVRVPGGAYDRSNNGSYPATVSDLRLDVYEVTVGRFREFVAGYPANKPVPESGKNPSNAADPGWDPAWNTSGVLPDDKDAFIALLKCSPTFETWTDEPGPNENVAMNCISWYEAFAFCIWDGGRLPTEAEWNYAAAGGAEQRVYPWSSPPSSTTLDKTFATYGAGAAAVVGKVGSKPKGAARWEQTDMAGNLWEWVLDWHAATPPVPCKDCANRTGGSNRVVRGGSFDSVATDELQTAYRGYGVAGSRYNVTGVRCARTLE